LAIHKHKHKHKADLMEPGQMTSASTSYIKHLYWSKDFYC